MDEGTIMTGRLEDYFDQHSQLLRDVKREVQTTRKSLEPEDMKKAAKEGAEYTANILEGNSSIISHLKGKIEDLERQGRRFIRYGVLFIGVAFMLGGATGAGIVAWAYEAEAGDRSYYTMDLSEAARDEDLCQALGGTIKTDTNTGEDGCAIMPE